MKISKIIFLSLILTVGILMISTAVQAKTEDTSKPGIIKKASDIRENIKDRIKERKATNSAEKDKKVERVRNAAVVRWEVLNKLVGKSEELLEKLQMRIDRAKKDGKDVTAIENNMADAKLKLNDAKKILSDVSGEKDQAIDKTAFQNIQKQFQTAKKDLNIVHQDAAKIIKGLKSFNAATPSTKRVEKEGSNSAEK